MKTIEQSQASLESCVHSAQSERVVITRDGEPVALIVGLEGFDTEQIELGSSEEFWRMIQDRRRQPAISREQLDRRWNAPQ
ncbi:MAG: hypothetical protein AB7O62_03155 [Pirellulales bacterium]